ncbi:hypothetical protein R1CP_37085 (plasmid) [Rhodococcus opacus]|uniref:Uncharacterized protein n=1 Tax=Rhodococcus opacus TaxID=37919 RepID=A0A1B1KHC4_RHOOP|nr:hypothetical protein [Rhodococcus opacus]ANS32023.1 hypothetical protein R1CP_37085 [Rhodococcus opacus]
MVTDYDAPRHARVENIDSDEAELPGYRHPAVPVIEEDADDAVVEQGI